ncbi:MAG: helix-hairpin-helix domain-containing protein, partial [Clostridia bacterium]|nr:helix-hairpin-helix domain-containing protein [Clostridia bacterium]
LQPPLKGKIILGLDPAYRTGYKIAVIDSEGNVLDTAVVFPTPPQNRIDEAKETLLKLIKKHNVSIISIGNGTASKESEIFVANMIKESGKELAYAVVNEAGASVYSASKLGAEEFPDFEPAQRSAVSIARRLQDPLAELIKIDVKSIGVGQYQHDMPEARLEEVLGGVVEDCVNSVGVDLNTASPSLLSFVAGLNKGIAKEIVKYRESKPFTSREELLKVKKLGEKAFLQCAGFLRIIGGNVLDNTGVHPESYPAVEKLLSAVGYSLSDVADGKIGDLLAKIEQKGWEKTAEECGVGVPTLKDISAELLKPGRDIRDSLPKPILRSDLMDLADLKEGMEINGTVRNVIDFGVFVDIGVHQDGLVHISQISDNYIKHPSDVLKVGDLVKVKVLGVDTVKKKISLTMKTTDLPHGINAGNQKTDRERKQGRQNAEKKRAEKRQLTDEELKQLLLKKFGR